MKKSIPCVLLAAFVSLQCLSSVSCGEKNDTAVLASEIIKVKFTVYVHSLSLYYIKHTLFSFFMRHEGYIQLDMVPYGRTKQHKNKAGKWEFTCPHGPPECLGNMYLACATHVLQQEQPKELMRYYKCLADASLSSMQKDVVKCAGKNFYIDRCVKQKGPEVLTRYGNRTPAHMFQYFPYVVLDDTYRRGYRVMNHLLHFFCLALRGRKPKECRYAEIQPSTAEELIDIQNGTSYLEYLTTMSTTV